MKVYLLYVNATRQIEIYGIRKHSLRQINSHPIDSWDAEIAKII